MRKPMLGLFALLGAAVPLLLGPAATASNDPMFPRQYGLKQIGAPEAWSKSRGAGVIIAVVDSGVDVQHPDLAGKIVAGYDFGDGDTNPDDDSPLKDGEGKLIKGHGTHVAGIASAITDNNVGVAGVAPDAKIMPLKVFPSKNNASLLSAVTAVPQAIRYAYQHGAKVINLSLGGVKGLSFVGDIESPCAEAFSNGALCVVASGNSGDNPSGYARGVQFLIVTANDDKGQHASFGQYADTQWGVSAPGVKILSTYPVENGSYAEEQGTSMAAPHAAGVAALLFAQGLGPAQVVDRILSTTTPMGSPGVNGAGRINAAGAVGAVHAAASVTSTTVGARDRTATTRQSAQSQAIDEFLGTPTTRVQLDTATTEPGDDLAFAGGGPGENTKLQAAAVRKPAKQVSVAVMALTLVALAVIGGAIGGFSVLRRRGTAGP